MTLNTQHNSLAQPFESFHFICVADYEQLSRRTATFLQEEIRKHPNLLLCAAAGSSPRRSYQLLGEAAANDPALFERVRILKVDEWGGLPEGDPATCEHDLRQNLLMPLRVSPDRYQGFSSSPADPSNEAERIGQWVAQNGPIDICVLGLGTNGHVAMNEPADELWAAAHVANLAQSSLGHSMLATARQPPAYGLTLGFREILNSRKIVLLVSGEAKRAVFARLQKPAITPQFPASFLWLHPDVTILHDRAAAGASLANSYGT